MRHIHRPLGGHPRGSWVGVFAVLMLTVLPLLAASTFSAPAAQTLHPVSYLPLVLRPPRYEIAYISYQNGNFEIFKMNADGSHQTNLTNNPAWDGKLEGGRLAWSPDGRQIAFVSYRDGSDEIYVMNADGSHQTDLSNSRADDLNPIWSPAGRQIAFLSTRDEGLQIYVVNADGSHLTRLTNNQPGEWPVLSPDWRRVACTVVFDCGMDCYIHDIYTMNVDGSDRTNLTPGPGDDFAPVWSPDGRQIAFTSSRPLYVMNADGSNKTKLGTAQGLLDGEYVWSPNGRQIAFVSGNRSSIYVVNADGSGLTDLSASGSNPDWSPDGGQIAFEGYINNSAGTYIAGIYVMNADGSHQTRLTDNSEDRGPVWSPPLP